jgi:hypothetical protein
VPEASLPVKFRMVRGSVRFPFSTFSSLASSFQFFSFQLSVFSFLLPSSLVLTSAPKAYKVFTQTKGFA